MRLLKRILGLSFLALSSFQGQATSLEENDDVILWGRCYPISSTIKIHFRHQLTGRIPESIGNLSNLTILDLAENKLTGRIPESIGNLSNLTRLNLAENKLTGRIPESIGNLSNLRELYLSSNQLTEMYPNLFTLSGVVRLARNHLNLVPGSQTPISVKSDAVTIGVGGESFNPKLFTCFEERADHPVKFHLSSLQGTPVAALEGYTIWFKKEKDAEAEGNEKDIIEGRDNDIGKDLPRTNLPPALQEAVDFILSEKNFKGDTRKSARSDLSS